MDTISPLVRRWLDEAAADPVAYWDHEARGVPWFRTWDTAFEPDPPSFRWFVGGLTNLSYNALDRHVSAGRAGHAALVAENELGERRVLTYAQLHHEVRQVSAALRAAGVKAGDRVAIYMPTTPEAICAMLACTRIGAIHVVVFAGFGAGALGERIALSGATLLLTADGTWRKGKLVPLGGIVAEALADPESPVRQVVVLSRQGDAPPLLPVPVVLGWEEFVARGEGTASDHVEVESNVPAFILATSGTTAKPKLAVHTHGPYQVGIVSAARRCFAMSERDVWWSTSDIGWIVGHSYIVYAPLILGATTIVYEGAIDHPGPETFYRIIEENRVSGLFTAPTAVRLLMRSGLEPARRHDLSSMERVLCAGEALNVPAWEWLQREVFSDRVPVIDHMWQTETGGPVFGNPYGVDLLPIKPGSAGIPLAGYAAEVRNPDGTPCAAMEKGIVVVTRPFPGLTPTIWGDPERYATDYWGKMPGVYFTGDAAHVDEDGYFWFSGRADEIIKIAGHRIGTVEVESAFLRHPLVAEAAATGRPDELRGEVVSAFVVLRSGVEPSDALRAELRDVVRRELGPVVVISDVNFVTTLPKTRSGKIMRRVLRAVTLEQDPGDISTIEDGASVEEARGAWRNLRAEIAGLGEPAPG